MKLFMKQKVFSWGDKFTVKDAEERDRYRVEGEVFSWGKKLHVYDEQGQEAAFIHQKLMSWLPRYIVDIDGREVCQIVKKFTFLRPQYELIGLPWRVEGDFWVHEYVLYDDSREIMRLSKHWFTWGDSYELDIADDRDTLLCLCVVLAIDAAVAQEQAAASSASH